MEEKHVGQRGPDKETREFNPKSLLNLKQFKPASNVSLSVNPDVNSGVNWGKLGKIVIIGIIISAIVWKLYQGKNILTAKIRINRIC